MNVLLCVSASREETARLADSGPRRDFLELAARTGGQVLYREGAARRGLFGKLLGPHIRQAWQAAARVTSETRLFADGEHVGLPLLAMLALRRKKPAATVVLVHLLRRWKLPILWLATRTGNRGVLVVHSVEQASLARRFAGRSWGVELVPYQVDTAYWAPPETETAAEHGPPLLVAAGSENRDYETLARAVEGLSVEVVIAAGSHWARTTATAGVLPANVTYFDHPLSFAELRKLYARAAAVVVPLHDVPNQSGITTILEAMSMAKPVVVTASRGQRECVVGPLVRSDGALDTTATASRGPQAFGASPLGGAPNGYYVPVGDSGALRRAIERLVSDSETAAAFGLTGRWRAGANFGVEAFAARLDALLQAERAADLASYAPESA